MEKKTLKVEGMSCQHCVNAVSKAAGGFSGVSKVKVDLKTGSLSFQLDPGKTGLQEIIAAVTEAGFTVKA